MHASLHNSKVSSSVCFWIKSNENASALVQKCHDMEKCCPSHNWFGFVLDGIVSFVCMFVCFGCCLGCLSLGYTKEGFFQRVHSCSRWLLMMCLAQLLFPLYPLARLFRCLLSVYRVQGSDFLDRTDRRDEALATTRWLIDCDSKTIGVEDFDVMVSCETCIEFDVISRDTASQMLWGGGRSWVSE